MFIAFVAEFAGEAMVYGLSRCLDTVVQNLYGTYASPRFEPHFNESNAVTNDELFDVINPTTTRECVDELFSCLIKDPSQMSDDGIESSEMNGDIDPMRIESLNTATDDNKVLTLPGNERIALTQTMCLPFDLSWSTTPATVFHSGILTPDVTHEQMLCTLLDCLLTPRMACPPETARDVYETYFVFTCLWVFGSVTFQDQDIRPENEYLISTLIHSNFVDGIGDQNCMHVRSSPVLQTILNDAMKSNNEFLGALNLVQFSCWINRIYEVPRGNSLRYLGPLLDLQNVDLKVDLNTLYIMAGLKVISVVLAMIDTQAADDSLTLLINGMLASDEIRELFADDEIGNFIQTIAQEVNATGLSKIKQNFFVNKVETLIKMVFCCSPAGNRLRIGSRNFPDLVNWTPINWLNERPKDTLESLSFSLLRGLVKDDETSNIDRNTCVMLEGVLDSSIRITEEPEPTKMQMLKEREFKQTYAPKPVKKLSKSMDTYHPVQLLNELIPDLQYDVTVISNPPADIRVKCIINGILMVGRASTKKAAQRQIAVEALDMFYGIRLPNSHDQTTHAIGGTRSH